MAATPVNVRLVPIFGLLERAACFASSSLLVPGAQLLPSLAFLALFFALPPSL
jgi:hypothetical protein